ncbi:MAG: hypothetical protein IPG25_04215 [Proteobacteria bacterium]|nr:hypothetical protein [Pseudomonadota bacterium]
MNQQRAVDDSHDGQLEDAAARRSRVRRTALLLGLVALSFYLGFILLSVARTS